MRRYLALPLLLVLGLFSSASLAQVMNFESFPDDAECPEAGGPVIENGLRLVDDTPMPPFSLDSCVAGPDADVDLVTNGTVVFAWCGACDQLITLTLTRQDAAPFNLESIDFNRFPMETSPGTVNVTGYPAGGGAPVTTQVVLTADEWITASFDSRFSDLERVELANDAFPGVDRMLDNIVTTQAGSGAAATPVPVTGPFGLLLLAAGVLLAAAGVLRRR